MKFFYNPISSLVHDYVGKTYRDSSSGSSGEISGDNQTDEEGKVLPTISSTAPAQIQTNQPVEYKVSIDPKDFAGEMVYVEITSDMDPAKLNSLEYKEGTEWKNLPKSEGNVYIFGAPSVGFPMSASATSEFRINVKESGTYGITLKIIRVSDKKVLQTYNLIMEAVA